MGNHLLLKTGQVVGGIGCVTAFILSAPVFWMGIKDIFKFGNPDNLGIGIGLAIFLIIGGPSNLLFAWCRGKLNRE